MKDVSQVRTAVRTGYNLTAVPRLRAEWNMNRYFDTTVDNTPSEDTDGYDIEMFPIESIVDPLRPLRGNVKAMVDAAVVADNYNENDAARFSVSSVDDKYKYWLSPTMSDNNGYITGCKPHVIYGRNVSVNKVVVKLENTWATPTEWYIDYTTVASPTSGDWTRLVTNPTVRDDGQVILYYNGTNWSSNEPATLTSMQSIRGLRITVERLGAGKQPDGTTTYYRQWNRNTKSYVDVPTNGRNAHFALIELSARKDVDLSDRLVEVTDTFDAGESSFLTPMGTITTNNATVTLWNGDNVFSKDNESSPYDQILEPNVKMNLEYVYTINGSQYVVQQFKMYANRWSGSMGHLATVDMSDSSKFLKEMTPPPMMFEEVTLREIIYRLCDSVGFSNYRITYLWEKRDFIIPVWWTDGEKTVWEVMDELATATQSLIYVDPWGILHVRPREAGFNPDRPTDWTLRGQKSGSELADIISFEQTSEYEANVVKVAYQKTRWSNWNNGQPSLATVWEPDGTVALRSANIMKSIAPSGGWGTETINLTTKEVRIWPYEGLVNCEGEFIRYKGKQYVYYEKDSNGDLQRKKAWVESHDDLQRYRRRTPDTKRHKNHLTGRLKITVRGVWNSREREHDPRPKNYDVRRLVGSNNITSKKGYVFHRKQSTITLKSAGKLKKQSHRLLATTGSSNVVGKYQMYGTRIKFAGGKAFKDQIAGLVIHNRNNDENGYYIELCPSLSNAKGKGKKHKQVSVYSRSARNVTGENNAVISRVVDRLPEEDGRRTSGTTADVRVAHAGDDDHNHNRRDDKDGRRDGKRDGKRGKDSTKKKKKGKKKSLVEYDLDVWIEKDPDGPHRIKVWLNGMEKANVEFKGDDRHDFNTKFGFYIRGKTKATFEYLYAIEEHAGLKEPPDDMSFFDRVRGGYYGRFADRELPHQHSTRIRQETRNSTKNRNKKPTYFFDEFGAIVQEIREFDVKFTEGPVSHSRLYMTNDWSAVCTQYNATPFSAKFIVANASRNNSVINGGESLSEYGGNQEVDHRLNVIGRPLIIDEAEEVTRKNKKQVRSRGEIEVQFASPWIQSKDGAKVIADWVLNHWSTGIDGASVTVFGNPLFEIGDVVEVDLPEKSLEPATARYFVTGITTSFTNGVNTSLTLRRVAPPVPEEDVV